METNPKELLIKPQSILEILRKESPLYKIKPNCYPILDEFAYDRFKNYLNKFKES